MWDSNLIGEFCNTRIVSSCVLENKLHEINVKLLKIIFENNDTFNVNRQAIIEFHLHYSK